MYSLLFESTALNGAGVRFVEYAGADEAEESGTERASNYMSVLACGRGWLSRACFSDIPPQSSHRNLRAPRFCSTALCVCLHVRSDTVAPPGLPILGHAFSATAPSAPMAVCLGYIRPRYIDLENEMKLGLCVSLFVWLLEGEITGCYTPAAAAEQWILLTWRLDNKADSAGEKLCGV